MNLKFPSVATPHPQWAAAFGASMLCVQIGFINGWASPILARLQQPTSVLPVTATEASWIASLTNVGRCFGALLGALALQFAGSRRTQLLAGVPIALGWSTVLFARSVAWLYLSRLSSGIGLGMSLSTYPIYVGEVATPRMRGPLLALALVGVPLAQAVGSLCGAKLSMRSGAGIYLGMSLLLITVFWILPESPHHCVKLGDREAAKKSIAWYRRGEGVDEELEAVEIFVSSNINDNGQGGGIRGEWLEKLQELRKPEVRRALYQALALQTFLHLCGLNAVSFYMESILIRANFHLIRASDLVTVAVSVGAVAAGISIVLMKKLARRTLLILSTLGMIASLAGLITHFSTMTNHPAVAGFKDSTTSRRQYLPLVSIISYFACNFLGHTPVTSLATSDIFPAKVKSLAAFATTLWGAAVSFAVIKSVQPIMDGFGMVCLLSIYLVSCVLVVPYASFFMLETKDKSLREVQEDFANYRVCAAGF